MIPRHLHAAVRRTVVADVSVKTTAGTRTLALTGYGTAPGLLPVGPAGLVARSTPAPAERHSPSPSANSWNKPETITGLRLPSAPFTVKGLPRRHRAHPTTISDGVGGLRPADGRTNKRRRDDPRAMRARCRCL